MQSLHGTWESLHSTWEAWVLLDPATFGEAKRAPGWKRKPDDWHPGPAPANT